MVFAMVLLVVVVIVLLLQYGDVVGDGNGKLMVVMARKRWLLHHTPQRNFVDDGDKLILPAEVAVRACLCDGDGDGDGDSLFFSISARNSSYCVKQ